MYVFSFNVLEGRQFGKDENRNGVLTKSMESDQIVFYNLVESCKNLNVINVLKHTRNHWFKITTSMLL